VEVYEKTQQTYELALNYHNLAKIYERKGHYYKAKAYAEKALNRWKSLGEKGQLDSIRALYLLGFIAKRQADTYATQHYAEQSLNLFPQDEEGHLISHRRLGKTYSVSALANEMQAKYKEALQYHRKSLKNNLIKIGEQHPDVAISYYNLGKVYYYQGQYEQAHIMTRV
jgi:tetratricopeptide (TPR) repeat protein